MVVILVRILFPLVFLESPIQTFAPVKASNSFHSPEVGLPEDEAYSNYFAGCQTVRLRVCEVQDRQVIENWCRDLVLRAV